MVLSLELGLRRSSEFVSLRSFLMASDCTTGLEHRGGQRILPSVRKRHEFQQQFVGTNARELKHAESLNFVRTHCEVMRSHKTAMLHTHLHLQPHPHLHPQNTAQKNAPLRPTSRIQRPEPHPNPTRFQNARPTAPQHTREPSTFFTSPTSPSSAPHPLGALNKQHSSRHFWPNIRSTRSNGVSVFFSRLVALTGLLEEGVTSARLCPTSTSSQSQVPSSNLALS